MKFGIDFCTKVVFKKGKLVLSRNLVLNVTRKYKGWNTEKRTSTLGLRKVKYTISTNDRKIEEGINYKIQNDTEIRVEFQE
jgi:hypothetical protein